MWLCCSHRYMFIRLWSVSKAHIALCYLLGCLYFYGEPGSSCRVWFKLQWSVCLYVFTAARLPASYWIAWRLEVYSRGTLLESIPPPASLQHILLACFFFDGWRAPLLVSSLIYFPLLLLIIRRIWSWLARLFPALSLCFDGVIRFLSQRRFFSQQPRQGCQLSSRMFEGLTERDLWVWGSADRWIDRPTDKPPGTPTDRPSVSVVCQKTCWITALDVSAPHC